MRLVLMLFCAMALVGCTENPVTKEEPKKTESITEEELEAAKQEGYDEGYEVGHEEGLEAGKGEGYDEAYAEGYDAGIALAPPPPDISIPDTAPLPGSSVKGAGKPVGGLTAQSDGLDWQITPSFQKKQFIEDLAKKRNEYLSFTEVDNVVYAIDDFYKHNSSIKTVEEVIEELK